MTSQPQEPAISLKNQAMSAYLEQDFTRTLDYLQQILAIEPDNIDALVMSGEIWLRADQPGKAINLLDRAVQVKPDHALAWYNLGFALQKIGEWDLAEKAIDACLKLDGKIAKAHFIKGNIYRHRGLYPEAIEAYKDSLRIDETYPDAWNNLGLSLSETDHLEEAAGAYLNALKHDYTLVSAHSNLGILLLQVGQLAGARRACERALEMDPNNHFSYNTLGSIYSQFGQHDEAIKCFRKAMEIKPDFWMGHSNLLFCTLHRDGTKLDEVFKLHQEWYEAHGKKHVRPNVTFKNTKDPNRRLRVGFVSGDFRSHPVGYFILNTVRKIYEESPFDLYLYANQFEMGPDYFAKEFQRLAGDKWRPIWEETTEKLLAQIEADEIDILFDLTGHNSRHRLDVFCARAAPVQVTWAGYMATTGVPQMDWLLGDKVQTPAEDQAFYSERLYQMPDSFICYTPPPDAPPLKGVPPFDENGYISFSSFNKPTKVTERTIRLWADIMRQVPESRLLMKFSGLADQEITKFFTDRFESHGITSDRISFENSSPHHELLDRYNRTDIALDPVPYTGSTTTLEALWMATPLVTLPGDIFPARHAATYLTSIGATELIAKDEADYVKKIVALARDPARLRHYKAHLREQMLNSPLCDLSKFVPAFVAAIRHFWQDYCSRTG